MHSTSFADTTAWIEFVIFSVIPIGFAQIYDWLKEWQILLAGLLILLGMRYWAKAVIRSSLRTSQAIIQSTRTLTEASGRMAPREAPGSFFSDIKPLRDIASLADINVKNNGATMRGMDSQTQQPQELGPRLEALRNLIRVALSVSPVSGSALSGQSAELYRKVASFSFEDIRSAVSHDQECSRLAQRFLKELRVLKTKVPEQLECQEAWQILVRINGLARELGEKLFAAEQQSRDVPPVVRESVEPQVAS